MLALLATGSDALEGYTGDLGDVADAAKLMMDVQQEGIVGVMTNMSSAASTLSIVIGKELEPVFTDFALTATDGMRWLGEHIGDVVRGAKAIATGIAVSFTAAGAAYLILNAQLVATTLAITAAKLAMIAFNFVTLANPISLLVTALGAAVAANIYWKDEIDKFPQSFSDFAVTAEVAGEGVAALTGWVEGAGLPTQQLAEDLDTTADAARSAAAAMAAAADAEFAAFILAVEGQSTAVLDWQWALSKIGREVDLIAPPMHNLTGTIEGQSATLGLYGMSLSKVGWSLDPLPRSSRRPRRRRVNWT